MSTENQGRRTTPMDGDNFKRRRISDVQEEQYMVARRYTVVFTGTVDGMTSEQKRTVRKALKRAEHLYHGSAVGADHEAARIWLDDLHGLISRLTAYPSDLAGMVATTPAGHTLPPAPPLKRNKQMVDDAIARGQPLVIAAPKTMQEVLRSGTWSVIRYARKKKVPVFIAFPDGTWTWDNLEEAK